MKEFDRWNTQKKILDNRKVDFLYKEGEIWWCSIGINIGSEIYGKGESFQRPVLIFKKLSNKMFIGIPISSKVKQGSWFQEITMHTNKRWVLLYQIRMFSVNRFYRRIQTLSSKDFDKVKRKLEVLLKLS